MPRTRIKICGITSEPGLRAACDAGADAVGFVFYSKSRRFIEPERAFGLVSRLPPFVASVAVFSDVDVDRFADVEEVCPTDKSQLHGEDSEDTVRRCGPGVIKAVRFDPATIAGELARWSAVEEVDAILVDGSAGGEGAAFDWSALARAAPAAAKPIIIAGGLTPANVAEAIRAVRPYGVDVSSGVESEPGVKDARLIEEFCSAVRRADAMTKP